MDLIWTQEEKLNKIEEIKQKIERLEAYREKTERNTKQKEEYSRILKKIHKKINKLKYLGNYTYDNEKLYYKSDCNTKLEIIACAALSMESNRKVTEMTKEVKDIFKSLWYNKNSTAFLSSGDDLYNVIIQKYIGISRKLCKEYVKNQEIWQLKTNITEHKTINPIVKRYPNELWCYDLIDFQKYYRKNKGYRWLLVVIDHFSKFGWVFPLYTKTREDVKYNRQNFLLPILKKLIDTETAPISMLSDNEFRDESIKALYEKYKIIGRTSLPYTPQQNGCAERFVKTIKEKIMRYMLVDQTYIHVLDNIVYNYNNQIHSTTGFRPVEVYRFGTPEIFEKVYQNTKRNAERMISQKKPKLKDTFFNINDMVRINYHAQREKRTDKIKIKSNKLYSEDIYTVINKKRNKSGEMYLLDKFRTTSKITFWNESKPTSEPTPKPVNYLSIQNELPYVKLSSLEETKEIENIYASDNGYIINFKFEASTEFKKELLKNLFVETEDDNVMGSKNIHIYFLHGNLTKKTIEPSVEKDDIIIIIKEKHFKKEQENSLIKKYNTYKNLHFYNWEILHPDNRWYYGYQLLKLEKEPEREEIQVDDKFEDYFDINMYHPDIFNSLDTDNFIKLKNDLWNDLKKMNPKNKEELKDLYIQYLNNTSISKTRNFKDLVREVEEKYLNKTNKKKNNITTLDEVSKYNKRQERKKKTPDRFKNFDLTLKRKKR